MKIVFFIARYSKSGVPLAQIRLARAFRQRGHEVHFAVGFVPEDMDMPKISKVDVLNFNKARTYRLLLPIYKYIKKECPDVIFTAEDHLNLIVIISTILARSKAKISASSRVTPFDTYSNLIFTKRWFLKQLNYLFKRRADALTCVSRDMVKQYDSLFGSGVYQYIYNIIRDSHTYKMANEPLQDKWISSSPVPIIISAGRLAPEKGYFDLIYAVKAVLEKRQVRLAILGDGPLKDELQETIDREGLSDSIRLLGFQANPLKYFAHSSVFVLSSYVEGLPNVLVEAMCCGCTPVSTNCPTGPSEVLQDGKYGYLVPMRDPASMADAIFLAIDNPISKALLDEAVIPFEEDRIISLHFQMLGLCEE